MTYCREGIDYKLGFWLHKQRKLKRAGLILPEREKRLQELVDAGLLKWNMKFNADETRSKKALEELGLAMAYELLGDSMMPAVLPAVTGVPPVSLSPPVPGIIPVLPAVSGIPPVSIVNPLVPPFPLDATENIVPAAIATGGIPQSLIQGIPESKPPELRDGVGSQLSSASPHT
jgi:hypothetical protein